MRSRKWRHVRKKKQQARKTFGRYASTATKQQYHAIRPPTPERRGYYPTKYWKKKQWAWPWFAKFTFTLSKHCLGNLLSTVSPASPSFVCLSLGVSVGFASVRFPTCVNEEGEGSLTPGVRSSVHRGELGCAAAWFSVLKTPIAKD